MWTCQALGSAKAIFSVVQKKMMVIQEERRREAHCPKFKKMSIVKPQPWTSTTWPVHSPKIPLPCFPTSPQTHSHGSATVLQSRASPVHHALWHHRSWPSGATKVAEGPLTVCWVQLNGMSWFQVQKVDAYVSVRPAGNTKGLEY